MLDSRVASYGPDLPHASEVTIRQLLTHTVDIDRGAEAGLHPHQLVVAASVFKVAVAATDAIIARVGLDHINATLQVLGLRHTVLTSDLRGLLASIAEDAGVPSWDALRSLAACAEVRQLMRLQASHRIATGFPSEVTVQAKSGSLLGWIRNEIGVVTYPDGQRYAVAVFTRAHQRAARQPAIDQAIGTVAALAVEHLRCGASEL